MKILQLGERDLMGAWVPGGGRELEADETAKRIEWLTSMVLEKGADCPRSGGWESLFRDPTDGRLWELTYPQGEMHGGGPPRLTNISETDARKKYQWS
jgi:hypothetical protein